jgi:hypothetical protein
MRRIRVRPVLSAERPVEPAAFRPVFDHVRSPPETIQPARQIVMSPSIKGGHTRSTTSIGVSLESRSASISRQASIQTLGATSTKRHNSIHNLDTKWFRNDTGEFPAIVMGLDIGDQETWALYRSRHRAVQEPADAQPTNRPHDMTITVAGDVSAERFPDLWSQRSASDPILKQFMSMMVHADILHIRGRELLGPRFLDDLRETTATFRSSSLTATTLAWPLMA